LRQTGKRHEHFCSRAAAIEATGGGGPGMNARDIAKALDAKAHREGHDWRCICPVHGGRSLTLSDGDYGKLLVKCWAGCDSRDILAQLRQCGLFTGDIYRSRPHPIRRIGRCQVEAPPPAESPEERAQRIEWARRVWAATGDAPGSPVEIYLRGRGITIALPPVLRWSPSC
jgi:putative DNA primase/helicase